MSAPASPPVAAATTEHLNPQQRAAVDYRGSAPLLVIAGAGSGKTNTLAHRVAQLVLGGADPAAILLLTFSRRAAVEMTRRVERILGAASDDPALARAALTWAGTFHGIGARLLREYAERIGLGQSFTIHDREDSADLINLVRHELGFSAKEKRFPTKQTCLAIYSRVVNTEAPLADVLRDSFPWCAMWHDDLRALFGAYVAAKQRQDVLDYDDLLLYWAHMASEPTLAAELGARFEHVLVDEYQDTNRLQAAILKALKPDGRGLTVVGDDAQSIYSFRGATVRNILEFPDQFAPPAAVVTLERNYRSTQPILAASNAVIGLAAERFTKNLWSERKATQRPQIVTVRDDADQARYVVAQVLARREEGVRLKKQAVLFRAAHHSAPLEIELTRSNVPFVKFGGLKFLEAAHVKDMLSVLRWVENPRDRVAGFRAVQLMPGIGPKSAARIVDLVEAANDPVAALADFPPPPSTGEAWAALPQLLGDLRLRGAWPGDIERVRRWFAPHLERKYEDAAIREADLLQMERIAASYPSRERFLTELTLDPPDATSDQSGVPLLDEDYLILSTIHSAKGQEWESVYLLNTVDGCIPSDMATGSSAEIEEERRLLYVAMTRAKDSLHLITPQRFYITQQAGAGDRHVYAQRTRFIPASMLEHFDDVVWPVAGGTAAGVVTRPPQAVIDIAAKLRGMWR
ncbi:ATP-dependent helicase [Niveibacterium sp. 24ML]|uniref:ATP-dependent helicase n=1 Tax=Niveibacterium sp. 24ML TaxID=2985512 RepID=UPI0022721451|nr:ATP-dependent helicase [Niveibacterium sp. 24ML]MCX9154775.1 ATP-dependent helicase [Niveibacterium sp. 24ML]